MEPVRPVTPVGWGTDMSGWVLVPWGNAFLRLTEAEFAAAMGRGLVPGPISAPTSPATAGEGLLDSRAMGERLGVGEEQVEALARRGEIPSVRVGRYLRFDPVEVRRVLGNGHAVR